MTSTRLREGRLTNIIRRSEFFSLVIIAISLLSFASFAIATDYNLVIAALKRIGATTVAIILALASINYSLRVVRFRYLLRQLRFDAPLSELIQIYVAGFAMSATPGKLGELIRMWFLKRRYSFPYRQSLPVSMADRATDAMSLSLLSMVSVGAFPRYLVPAVAMGLLLFSGCALAMHPRLLMMLIERFYALVGRGKRLFGRLRQIVRHTSRLLQFKPLFVTLLLSCAGWFFECFGIYICASIFSPDITVRQSVFIFTFANLVGALTFLPAGIGGTEVLMVVLLASAGLSTEEAAVVTLIIRVATLWFGVACGYVALFKETKEVSFSNASGAIPTDVTSSKIGM